MINATGLQAQKAFPFDAIRYFRNCNPESYCTLEGDRVTYFAPHVPDAVRV